MRAGLIVTGVLGIGTAAVFGLAAVASAAFPQGSTIATMWNGVWNGAGIVKAMPQPIAVPAPGVVVIDNSSSGGASGTITAPSGVDVGLPVTPSDAAPAK